MSKRRFVYFTDEELKIMQNSISDLKLKKEIKEEFKEREYNRKQHEEWMNSRRTFYAC